MAQVPTGAIARPSDRSFIAFNALVSAVALGLITWVLVLRDGGTHGGAELDFLPTLNATLNGLSAVCLASGWFAIRRRAVRLHQRLMVGAFAASAVFFVSYLVYHYAHGDTRYQGQGWARGAYFAVLISHIALSTLVVPMALTLFYFAFQRRFRSHRRLARVALPIWLYVSVTGVVIYLMLRAAVGPAPA